MQSTQKVKEAEVAQRKNDHYKQFLESYILFLT